jgi:hypothetical protein
MDKQNEQREKAMKRTIINSILSQSVVLVLIDNAKKIIRVLPWGMNE